MQHAIFLDKDGTLIPDIPFNVNPSLITLNDHVGEGLKILKGLGYLFIVISNQSGVALGYFSIEKLLPVKIKISSLLNEFDVEIAAYYYCPHNVDGTIDEFAIKCNCRKPMPGLIIEAAKEFNINVSKSWMIGDILNDVEAGNRAGCKSILIDNGNETEWLKSDWRTPNFIAEDFLSAAKHIANYTKTELDVNVKHMEKL